MSAAERGKTERKGKQMDKSISGKKMAGYLRQIAAALESSNKKFTAKIVLKIDAEKGAVTR